MSLFADTAPEYIEPDTSSTTTVLPGSFGACRSDCTNASSMAASYVGAAFAAAT